MPASNRIHLVLGYACNHHCRYCTQEINGRPAGVKKHVSQKVIDFLNEKALNLYPNRLRICFFGGEPLLYLPIIKTLLKEVNQPNVRWRIHSNGDLLTQENVDLFNQYDVSFGLSHDGPNVLKTRGINVLADENRIALYNQLRWKFTEVVVTSYSQNLYEIHDYFQSVFRNANWGFKPVFLINPSSVPSDLLDYDFVKWEETVSQICEAAKRQIIEKKYLESTSWEANFVSRVICDAIVPVKESPFMRFSERCTVPHVDLSGTVSLCEQYTNPFKHESEEEKTIAFFKHVALNHPNCGTCQAFPYCHGLCPMENASLAPQQCRFLRIFYQGVYETHQFLYKNHSDSLRIALLDHLPHEFREKNNLNGAKGEGLAAHSYMLR